MILFPKSSIVVLCFRTADCQTGAASFLHNISQNMSLTNTKTGFSVKDILDLPDTNDEEGSITGAEEDTEGTETTKTTGVLVQSPLENVQNLPLKNPFYDTSDNPYTRWLATTDSIQYSRKCRLRILT